VELVAKFSFPIQSISEKGKRTVMATFKIKLTDLTVSAWFPPEEPIEEVLIEKAEGTYTVSVFGTSVGYYLEIDCGERMNPLHLGQAVQATGKDSEGKTVSTVVMETTGVGEIPQFKGPYQQALQASHAPLQLNSLAPLATQEGAQFWGYISPQNDTEKKVTDWTITLTQGNWVGKIDSAHPENILKTPGLSGTFDVLVEASGPDMKMKKLTPQKGSSVNIGANSNCSSMVGIVANEDGSDAQYWTTWDAFCQPKG